MRPPSREIVGVAFECEGNASRLVGHTIVHEEYIVGLAHPMPTTVSFLWGDHNREWVLPVWGRPTSTRCCSPSTLVVRGRRFICYAAL